MFDLELWTERTLHSLKKISTPSKKKNTLDNIPQATKYQNCSAWVISTRIDLPARRWSDVPGELQWDLMAIYQLLIESSFELHHIFCLLYHLLFCFSNGNSLFVFIVTNLFTLISLCINLNNSDKTLNQQDSFGPMSYEGLSQALTSVTRLAKTILPEPFQIQTDVCTYEPIWWFIRNIFLFNVFSFILNLAVGFKFISISGQACNCKSK